MFSWHAIPFVRILVPFIFGIFFALFLPVSFWIPACFIAVLFLLSLYFHFNKGIALNYRTRILQGISITLIIILLGYSRAYWFNETRQPDYFRNIEAAESYRITIDDAVIEKARFYRCYARIKAVIDSTGIQHSTDGLILFYIKRDHFVTKPLIGDQYLVRANISEIPDVANPEAFNYRKYLSYHNIYYQLFADASQMMKLPEIKLSIYRTAIQIRDKSLLILQKYIDSPKELGVAEALLLGYKDDLDPDIVAAFSRTGTLHVLAVSGLHAGIIYLILAFLTTPLAKKKYGRIFQVILLLFGIWLYAFITGLSSSVLRASVMFSFMAVGKLLKYHLNIYNNIFSSAFILLVYNPLFILDVGFQLSYLAVLGIVFIQPMIAKWYLPRYWLDKYVWGLISVSLAAQLLTFPIGIFYFHMFPNYFLLSNLLIIPITSLVLVLMIALLAFHAVPFMGLILGKTILHILQFNNWLVQGIDNLPFSYLNGLHFDMFQMLLLYGIFFLLTAFFIHRNKNLFRLSLLAIFCYSVYFSALRFKQSNQRMLVVHHIKGHDVFTCVDGRQATIISDTGFINNQTGIRFFLEPFFYKNGISRISKFDISQSFVTTNIYYEKNVGLQFYDRILTIDRILPESAQKNGIFLIRQPEPSFFKQLTFIPDYLKLSAMTNNFQKEIFRKKYFEEKEKILKEYKYFLLISF